MFHVDNNSAVPVMPAVKPVVSAVTSFFTEGGNGVPPTYPGPDWFNIIQSELLAILAAAGISPDKASNVQLLAAMRVLFLDASQNGADIPDKAAFLQNLGLQDVLHKGNGRLLTGTYVSDTEDAKSIGARAATGCQFMRAYKATDAPDQVNYWQIITMTDVVSPTSQVVVLAITTTTNAFAVGYGTGQGITMWRSIPALEGASFTGNINAPNIAAEFQLKAGQAIFRSDGDIYGSTWGVYGRLSGYLTGTFPSKTEVDEWLSQKPNRQFITQVGLYESDKTKPFMLHDDGTGVFLATKDMLSIASLGMTGWHKDNSTGLITQWGEVTTSQARSESIFHWLFQMPALG